MKGERVVVSFAAEGATVADGVLSGFAHVYGKRALVGDQYEVFAKGAFDAALRTSDVRAFLNHSGVRAGDVPLLLGRQSSGTLELDASGKGLAYKIHLPDTSYARDLQELVKRGDVNEMSFSFLPGQYAFSSAGDGRQIRTHTRVSELVDVAPVGIPAFAGTSVNLRARSFDGETAASQRARARDRVRKEKTA